MPDQILIALRARNPFPSSRRLDDEASAVIYDDTLRRIGMATADAASPRWHRRRSLVVAVAALALVLPALALSGTLDGLFAFSPHGTAPTESFDSLSVSALRRVDAPVGAVEQIAVRDGAAFYAAQSESQGLCLGVGEASAPSLTLEQLQCMGVGDAPFPTATLPVLRLSPTFFQQGAPAVYMSRLEGFAADAISRVSVSGSSGEVASADVSNNVFAVAVPHVPITSIAAFDAAGKEVWSSAVRRP